MLIKKHRFDKQVFMEDIKLDLVAAAVSLYSLNLTTHVPMLTIQGEFIGTVS
jgi:hypothetical protein